MHRATDGCLVHTVCGKCVAREVRLPTYSLQNSEKRGRGKHHLTQPTGFLCLTPSCLQYFTSSSLEGSLKKTHIVYVAEELLGPREKKGHFHKVR